MKDRSKIEKKTHRAYMRGYMRRKRHAEALAALVPAMHRLAAQLKRAMRSLP